MKGASTSKGFVPFSMGSLFYIPLQETELVFAAWSFCKLELFPPRQKRVCEENDHRSQTNLHLSQ